MPRKRKMPDLSHISADLRPLARPIVDLNEDPDNARKHPDRNLDALEASLRRYGMRKPVVVRRDGMIVEAGNGTLEVARRIGWTHIPVVIEDDDSFTAAGYAISDNRTAELAKWDDDQLSKVMSELVSGGVDMESLGWARSEIDRIVDGMTEPKEPDAPPAPAEPDSEPGKVYHLGPHRLVCGSSIDPEVWDAVMEGELADCLWTDPPYGVSVTEGLGQVKRSDQTFAPEPFRHDQIVGDTLAGDSLYGFLTAGLSTAMASLKDGAAIYVASSTNPSPLLEFTRAATTLKFARQILTWLKDERTFTRYDYQLRTEFIFYGWKPGGAHSFYGEKHYVDDVIEYPRPRGARVDGAHPTMKPTGLVALMLGNSTKPGDLVIDGFGGSGSTLLAAASLGRRANLVELEPAYCDLIRARWGAWARDNGHDPGSDAL